MIILINRGSRPRDAQYGKATTCIHAACEALCLVRLDGSGAPRRDPSPSEEIRSMGCGCGRCCHHPSHIHPKRDHRRLLRRPRSTGQHQLATFSRPGTRRAVTHPRGIPRGDQIELGKATVGSMVARGTRTSDTSATQFRPRNIPNHTSSGNNRPTWLADGGAWYWRCDWPPTS